MKKIIKFFICLPLLLSIIILPTSASSRAAGCIASTWYSPSTTLYKTFTNDTIIVTNSTSATQTISKSKTSTKYTSITYSGSVSSSQSYLGLITFAVGVSAETTASNSTTITRTVTINVPANTTIVTTLGYCYIVTNGSIKTQNEDCSIGSVSASAQYTYADYVKYEEQ